MTRREIAMKAIKILSSYKNSCFGDAHHGGVISVSEIIELLSAQPERNKGKWVPLISNSDGKHHEWCGYQCSICGEKTLRLIQHNFCPSCGAEMREE